MIQRTLGVGVGIIIGGAGGLGIYHHFNTGSEEKDKSQDNVVRPSGNGNKYVTFMKISNVRATDTRDREPFGPISSYHGQM